MRPDDIPPDNALQVYLKNLHANNASQTPIEDAVLTYTITVATGGAAVTGGTAISMPHDSDGNYFGNSTPTLVEGTRYKIVVTCSNYVAEWTRFYNAKNRPM